MARVLSGIVPTSIPHLGNYLGAIRWWVQDQQPGESFHCVADLHALTTPGDPEGLRRNSRRTAALLLACGLDPERCTLFVQSHVPAHTQLSWLLECTAAYGELQRMTQFKDKSAKGGAEDARVGLFTYPVLMAADILAYGAQRVPVGDDQRQHLELTRTLAQRFNARYGEVFVIPEAAIPPPGRGARVMDLQEPTAKMSKTSDSDAGTISLLDEPAVIERKIRRAVTDTDDGPGAVRYDPAAKPGVSGLLELLGVLTDRAPEAVSADYTRYGPLKADTTAAVIECVRPIQERFNEFDADPATVAKVLAAGAEQASAVASLTLARACDAVGLLPPGAGQRSPDPPSRPRR